jgi:DNA modification methylase
MELDPKYVDVIIKRWQDFTGQQATHEATGKTFAEISNVPQTA